MKKLALFAALTISQPVLASDWFLFSAPRNEYSYADRESAVRKGNTVSMWVQHVYHVPAADGVKASTVRMIVDCSARTLTLTSYKTEDKKGKVLMSSNPDFSPKVTEIIPDSKGDDLYILACKIGFPENVKGLHTTYGQTPIKFTEFLLEDDKKEKKDKK